MAVSIEVVNEWGYEDFIEKLGAVVEHHPALVAAVWSRRPFSSLYDLHRKLCTLMDQLPFEGMWSCRINSSAGPSGF